MYIFMHIAFNIFGFSMAYLMYSFRLPLLNVANYSFVEDFCICTQFSFRY